MDKNTLISSFGKWVAPIHFSYFEKQVAATNQDKYTKKLTTKAYLMLFLYAHLQEEESLRAISDAVLDDDLAQALGLDGISVSQLSRKNREVDPALLANVFVQLVQQIHWYRQGQKRMELPVKIIDSSTIPLNLTRYKWATFRKTKAGVKYALSLWTKKPSVRKRRSSHLLTYMTVPS